MININVENFLSYLGNERNASEHTLVSYRRDINQFARLVVCAELTEPLSFADIDWDIVDVYGAREFVVALQLEKLAVTSINRKVSSLRSFYRFMVREQYVDKNPI